MDRNKLITQLKKKYIENLDVDDEKVEHEKCFMEPSNVLAFIPKTKRLFKIFQETFDTEYKDTEYKDVPKLDFETKTSKFNVDFLTYILELLKKSDCDSVTFKVGDDTPLVAETKDFKIILAPMISEDD